VKHFENKKAGTIKIPYYDPSKIGFTPNGTYLNT
jgi:hypothetical protein